MKYRRLVLRCAGLFWSVCCCSSNGRNLQQKIGGGLPTGLDRTAAVILAIAAIISAVSVATISIAVLILTSRGTAAIIPDPAIPAIAAVPLTPVEATAEEVVTAVAAGAINGWPASRAAFSAVVQEFLDSFQSALTPVWNHLKQRFFLLHPAAVLNI